VSAGTIINPKKLTQILAEKAPFVSDLPRIAKRYGVSNDVIARAFNMHNEIAHSLEALGR